MKRQPRQQEETSVNRVSDIGFVNYIKSSHNSMKRRISPTVNGQRTFQRGTTNGQYAHEMLTIISHQENRKSAMK